MITRIIVEDSLAEFNDYATGATKRVTDERIKSTHTRLFKCILMLASSVEIEADFINNLKIGTSNFSWRRGGYDYSLNDEFREFDNYVTINYEDLYKNKVAYDVTYLDNDTFQVRLFHNPSVTFEDIPLAN